MLHDIHSYGPALMMAFGACMLAFMSPGPNFVGIVSTAVQSRFDGMMVAVGVSLGTLVWAVLAVTGSSALLKSYPELARAMQVCAGLYLIWLAYKSFKGAFSNAKPQLAQAPDRLTVSGSLSKGILIQLTNPKTALFWLSITSLVLRPDTPLIVTLVLVFGTTAMALIWHVLLALVFSIETVRIRYLGIKKYISLLFGATFSFLGGRLIYGVLVR